MPNWVVNRISMTGPQESINAALELLRSKDKEADAAIDFNNVIRMPSSLNLTAGGSDKDYIALYLSSLSGAERSAIALKLKAVETSFYGNYLRKYAGSFTHYIPEERRKVLEGSFQKEYSAINPTSAEDVGKTYIENILNYGADTWYDWSCKNWGTKWGPSNCSLNENGLSFDTAWSASLPITGKLSEMFPNVVFSHEYADENIGSNCGRCVFENGELVDDYVPEGEEAVRFACDIWEYDVSEYLDGLEDCLSPTLETQINTCAAQVVARDPESGSVDREAR